MASVNDIGDSGLLTALSLGNGKTGGSRDIVLNAWAGTPWYYKTAVALGGGTVGFEKGSIQ